MAILHRITTNFLKMRLNSIHYMMNNPVECQQKLFKVLINKASKTVWGHQYDYQSINSYYDYVNRIPPNNYDDIKMYIEDLIKGKKNVLWPGKTKWFATTSGTTSERTKYIPITNDALKHCNYKGIKDLLAIYCDNNPNSKIFTGKGLVIGGTKDWIKSQSNTYVADLSAIMLKNLPWPGNLLRTPSLKVALISDWERKLDIMVKTTVHENVTNISGLPSWALVFTKKILEYSNKKSLYEVWPNLEAIIYSGMNFSPYNKQFNDITQEKNINYVELYNASEGLFAIQTENNNKDLLLMLNHGIFYEFVRLEDVNQDTPKAYTIAEVEKDIDYMVVISTNAGLWRYYIGDTVRFTSLNPFKIRLSGRTKLFLNSVGERLKIEDAERSVFYACNETNSIVSEYSVAPIYFSKNESGRHEWLIEFQKTPDNIEIFKEYIDNFLKKINSDYEAKRSYNLALSSPIITCLPKGTFHKWLKRHGKMGGQHKVPRIWNNRTYANEIRVTVGLPSI